MANSYDNRVGFASDGISEETDTLSPISEDTGTDGNSITELEKRIENLEKVIDKLTEFELDKQGNRVGSIEVPSDKRFKSGDTSVFGLSDPIVNQQFGFLSTGKDFSEFRGYDLTEVITWYDGDLGLSAFYGRGGPIVVARDAVITNGSSILSSDGLLGFEVDTLIGKIVTVSTSTSVKGYQISANSKDTLTISGATFSATESDVQIEVLNTVYLGAGSSPWKRGYVEEGTGGGMRFGLGSTANGQNGLLYMDATGNLYWRNKGGTSTKLN